MQGNANNNFDQPRSTGKPTLSSTNPLSPGEEDNIDAESMESMHRGQLAQLNSKCKIHGTEDIKAFCKDCLCSICFKCLLGDHRNHDIVMLDELSVNDLRDKVT